jgi:carboxylesterase type B
LRRSYVTHEKGLNGDADSFSKPLLVTHIMNEADAVLPFSPISGVNQTESDLFTLAAFHCPVSQTANYTSSAGVPTYRYVYAGSFLETLSYPWLRPYHGSDLELVFKKGREDAYQDFGGEIKKAGRYLRDAVAAFVRDPKGGLVGFGWPRYEVGGEFMFSFAFPLLCCSDADSMDRIEAPTLVKLFGNNSAAVTFEDPAAYDAPCQYL